jgi:hexosaminidase
MRRLVLAVLIAAWCAPAADAAPNPKPSIVPTVGAWKGGEGTYRLTPRSRVVFTDRSLRGEAKTLARDLKLRTSPRGRARAGDIVLRHSNAGSLGTEGYRMVVGATARIGARGDAGVFYGGRTLIALLGKGTTAPRGVVRDVPRWRERGLMVDAGRKYFTPAWLEARVRELAGLRMNVLHLHLSDNEGFRIQSERFPEIVSKPALSKDEVRRLVELAGRYHVTVIPEIDMPGHLRAALASKPELQLRNATGGREPDKLDVTNPSARAFARALVEEYLPLFPGPYWHGGADEYLGVFSTPATYAAYPQLEQYARAKHGPTANGKDAALDFANFIGEIVRGAGKTLRVWSDGAGGGSAVTLDKDAVIEWWEEMHSESPRALAAAGHPVLNAGWWPTYYVNGPLSALRADLRQAYDGWEPFRFDGPYSSRWSGSDATTQTLDPADPKLTGAELHVWNDDPKAATEDEIAAGIAPRLRLIAQKTWGAPPMADTFERIR